MIKSPNEYAYVFFLIYVKENGGFRYRVALQGGAKVAKKDFFVIFWQFFGKKNKNIVFN